MGKFNRQKQPHIDKGIKVWKRSGIIIKHHIVNKCMGGSNEDSNLLKFDSEREKAWHFLFGNKSFEEASDLLLRCSAMKQRKNSAA